MGRIVLLAALLYGWGHPGFEGRRPDALDRPLRNFHRAVNATATDTRRAVAALDDLRTLRDLASALRPLNGAF